MGREYNCSIDYDSSNESLLNQRAWLIAERLETIVDAIDDNTKVQKQILKELKVNKGVS